ncbi:MAG: flagellar motor switch protein FliN [Pirellulaceae bacterium]|nr:flagellar motor switch protein FliN [Pirellulaceae bacterium]
MQPSTPPPNHETTPGPDLNEIEQLIDRTSDAVDAAVSDQPPRQAPLRPYQLNNLSRSTDTTTGQPIDLLGDVELDMRIELGRTQMTLQDVLHLRGGSVVALDALTGDPVNVYVNGRIVARGEILVMNDNFCVRVTELVGS